MNRSTALAAMFQLSSPAAALFWCIALGLIAGCEGDGGGSGGPPKSTGPEPARHPAMNLPAGAVGTGSGAQAPPGHAASPHGASPHGDSPQGTSLVGAGSAGALPAGHPPVPAPAAGPPAAAPAALAASPPAATGGAAREVQIGPLKLTAPEGWIAQPANPQFGVLAAFGLPRVEGDSEDARLTVSTVAGDLGQNLTRWQGQFKESPPVAPVVVDVAGMKVVTVRLAGTLKAGGPFMGGGAEKPNSKMWGAVLELPGQPQKVFLKATGPAKSMEKWDGSFAAFLNSLKKE